MRKRERERGRKRERERDRYRSKEREREKEVTLLSGCLCAKCTLLLATGDKEKSTYYAAAAKKLVARSDPKGLEGKLCIHKFYKIPFKISANFLENIISGIISFACQLIEKDIPK
jgi:hypothetical protein